MQDTGLSHYITQPKGEPNPFLNIRILRHGAYLGYLIYIFTDGIKHYMHVKNYKTGEPIETKEVSEDTFESFNYGKEYINDLLLLDSVWDLFEDRIMAGEKLEEILAGKPDDVPMVKAAMPDAWKAVLNGLRPDLTGRPPLLTGGRKYNSKGVTNGN